MLKNILNTLSNNKKTILYFIIFFVAFFALFDLASANTWTQSASDARFEQMKQTASIILELGTKIIVVFLSLITFLAALFLSPEWYNWSIFWLNWYFKDIWIIVSNFVYFVFAFILIWIAFMNIIWKWQDKYALKQALPKFVVWIFIVPISWFLVQFTLSVVSVLSIAALNLPFDTFKSFESDVSKMTISADCTLNLSDLKNINDDSADPKKYFSCKGDEKEVGDYLNSGNFTDWIFWIVAVYTYWILNLKEISEFTPNQITNIKTIWDVSIKLLFDFLFILIYSFLMIALWLVLFTRWIYLWVYIMISPVFWLMYFFWKSDWGSWFFEKFNVKEFLSLAMVPVYTMLALSLWLLFLYVIWQWITDNTSWSNFFKIEGSWTWTTLTVWDNQAKLTITWAPESSNSLSFLWSLGNQSLWIVWTLIMKIFWVVVLWMAVMAALSSSKITREIIKPLKDFWDQVWSLASKAPQYAPIFGGQSMQSLSTAAWTISSDFQTRQQRKWAEFWQQFLPLDDNAKALRDIANQTTNSFSEALNQFRKANWLAWAEKIATDRHARDAYLKTLNELVRHNSFNNPDEAIEKIDIIAKSNNASEIRQALVDLQNNWKTWQKLFWEQNANIWNIDLLISQNGTRDQQNSPNPWNPPAWNQTINLNIKNWNTILPISLNNVTLTDEQKANFSNIDINNLQNRSELISELQKIWITDTMIITNIIDDIIRLLWTNWDKFK